MVIQESSLAKGLPKRTESLCPECKIVIPAIIENVDGKAVIKKKCPEHGKFESVYWSDAEMYLRSERWAFDGIGVESPAIKDATTCPDNCGLCNLHLSHTCLANLDLTNRCNLQCPICFANANASGYVYEPTFDEVVGMLEVLRNQLPVPTKAVQFSGGEPTVYPRFFDVIKRASEMGFAQVQIATNGIKMARDESFAQRCVDSGLHTVYLQFDGLKEENYIQARGKPLLDIKLKAIENCRNTKPRPLATILVPTIVKTINDDQVGEILNFAIDNRDVVRGVNFQPVAFTGRISQEERERQRYTLSDLAKDLEKQTGFLSKDDFYPVPFVTPISELISVIKGEPQMAFTSHPHCGLATYVVISENGERTPITKYVDVEGLMKTMLERSEEWDNMLHRTAFKVGSKLKSEKGKQKSLAKNIHKYFGEHLKEEELPGGATLSDILASVITEGDKKSVGEFSWRTVFVGGMHFQDDYNYDIERVKRCVIHYAVPDGRVIPFCAFNGGPTYRKEIEEKYSIPLDEWRKKNEA